MVLGQQNNSAGRDGADGGGIVYINAATITGSGMINANGNQSATAGGILLVVAVLVVQ